MATATKVTPASEVERNVKAQVEAERQAETVDWPAPHILPEYMIKIGRDDKAKEYVLYAGLLDAAHRYGLRDMVTELIAWPNSSNDFTAICSATVIMQRGENVFTFRGIGDANGTNLGPMVKNCPIRMAETRAKARAMRDAVNIGICCLDELDLSEQGDRPSNSRQGPPTSNRQPQNGNRATSVSRKGQCPVCHAPDGKSCTKSCTAGANEVDDSEPDYDNQKPAATERPGATSSGPSAGQRQAINAICKKKGWDAFTTEELDDFTRQEAATWIDENSN